MRSSLESIVGCAILAVCSTIPLVFANKNDEMELSEMHNKYTIKIIGEIMEVLLLRPGKVPIG